MPESLSQRIVDSVRRHRMFAPGAVAGVAVSGGADSVALLLLFEELKATLGVRLLVVHFNHQLRGEESDCDEKFVRSLAEARGLEFIAGSEDVAGRARENGWNLEDAGRRLRYQFFAGLVQEGRAMRIAVAHTADDQAETVLAQMVRGTGPAGLAGIYPVTEAVVRPLLQVRRDELRAFLAGRRQTWREDSTNGDVSRLRARIRSRLTPLLEKDFSAGDRWTPGTVGWFGPGRRIVLAGLHRRRLSNAGSARGWPVYDLVERSPAAEGDLHGRGSRGPSGRFEKVGAADSAGAQGLPAGIQQPPRRGRNWARRSFREWAPSTATRWAGRGEGF